ncbi:hypothetical protein BJ973_002115 [Actinoplanes tereljensis]|uniref:Secreted protein n=1 Tax=Paractinoplanes tereljensis TaxID=571912 RepID=A0A919NKV7_9ACTN|nr:hypothetical protein [Actinoplanes tereljensis]GIF19980.1 hypothetical protein Ate02nite_27100 [Actinoplanes tereljensis]
MPAVIEATRTIARRAVRPETPARLRLWATLTVLTAVALLVSLSLLMARVQQQVRIIGDEAAPQAATAADLYFALSDMDAQVARMVLTADRDELAGSQIDALGTYQERSRQVDADVQKALSAESDHDRVLELMGHLATYRERVWQTLTAGDAAAGYYTQATNVLHLDLLPAAKDLRDSSTERLSQAYARKSATEGWAVTVAVGLGAALLILLVALQVWLARRFRRVFSPALLTATALTVALIIPAVAVLTLQASRLSEARDDSLTPFLALSRARAISYDAAADTSRFLISDNLAYYDDDFKRKSTCLAAGGSCGPTADEIEGGLPSVVGGPDVSPFDRDQVLTRWQAYRTDHERIVGLARGGKEEEAVGALTGIRRGDASFDFAYFDAAVADITAARSTEFDQALSDAKLVLTGWPWIPVAVLGLVIFLVPLAVRRRFAEYR